MLSNTNTTQKPTIVTKKNKTIAPRINVRIVAKNSLPDLVKIPHINIIKINPIKKNMNIRENSYVFWSKQA
jgi:hypothetical protein